MDPLVGIVDAVPVCIHENRDWGCGLGFSSEDRRQATDDAQGHYLQVFHYNTHAWAVEENR